MQWSHGSAPVGEVKSFYRGKTVHYYEKTAEYCVELSLAQYNERKNFNGENIDRRAQRGISEAVNSDGSSKRNAVRNSISDRNSGGAEVFSGYTVGEKLRNDAGRSISSSRGNNNSVSEVEDEDTQYQQRSSPLTNREVLELAASGVGFEQLNEAEKNALEIFGKRLDNLAQLQEERVNLGREYMKQQFTKGGSRQEAAKTLNAVFVWSVAEIFTSEIIVRCVISAEYK